MACIVLGSCAQTGDCKVSCTVRRKHSFWDALPQLQQQGITPQQLHPDDQQHDSRLKLAKLFPGFVDEQLLAAVQPLQQEAGSCQQLGSRAADGVASEAAMGRAWPGSLSSLLVEAGEGHGPRKEWFQAAAMNWTSQASLQVRVQQTCLVIG